MTSGKAFFDISGKEGNLARYTRIFRNYQPGTSVPFGFLPRILRNFRLNDSLFRNPTILGFFGNFLMKFPNQISLISEFLEFWLNEKCPHIKWMNSACIFMYIYTCIGWKRVPEATWCWFASAFVSSHYLFFFPPLFLPFFPFFPFFFLFFSAFLALCARHSDWISLAARIFRFNSFSAASAFSLAILLASTISRYSFSSVLNRSSSSLSCLFSSV